MIVDVLNKVYENVDLKMAAYVIPGTFLVVHIVPWLWDTHKIRAYPGPFIAKFSDIWLGYISKKGHRSERVHEAHLKYGMSEQSLTCLASDLVSLQ